MTTWRDVSNKFTKREQDLKDLLRRNMAIEFGRMSPWETPMGQQVADTIRKATTLGFGNVATALNKTGVPGSMIAGIGEEMSDRANRAAQSGVASLFQYYNPTQLAVERARMGLQLAQLRNDFYRNQLMEDAMNASQSGSSFGGIGSLIGGVAKLGLGLLPGGQIANLLGLWGGGT